VVLELGYIGNGDGMDNIIIAKEKDLVESKLHGHPKFYELTREEEELYRIKNKNYTNNGDPLGNFHRVSAILKIWGLNIPPSLVALIYALKQQDAAMWMLSQDYEGKVEGVDLRLRDDHVYKKITRILLEEEKHDRV